MIKFWPNIKRHSKGACGLLLLLIALIVTPKTAYPSGFEAYKGCFVQLNGWERDNIEGMSMSYSGIDMVTANTRYSKGDKEIEVTFVVGSVPGLQQPALDGTFQMETSEGSVQVKTIRGKTVSIVHDKTDNSSTVSIVLTKPQGDKGTAGSMLTLVGTNVDTKELLDIAQKFDWKCFEKRGHGK